MKNKYCKQCFLECEAHKEPPCNNLSDNYINNCNRGFLYHIQCLSVVLQLCPFTWFSCSHLQNNLATNNTWHDFFIPSSLHRCNRIIQE